MGFPVGPAILRSRNGFVQKLPPTRIGRRCAHLSDGNRPGGWTRPGVPADMPEGAPSVLSLPVPPRTSHAPPPGPGSTDSWVNASQLCRVLGEKGLVGGLLASPERVCCALTAWDASSSVWISSDWGSGEGREPRSWSCGAMESSPEPQSHSGCYRNSVCGSGEKLYSLRISFSRNSY